MISIVTKWWVKDGCEAKAIPALQDLAEQVREKEPYTVMYLIHTSIVEGSLPTPSPNEVIFVGTWDNKEAFDKHLVGPVFKDWPEKHIDLFVIGDGGSLYVSSEFVDHKAGFIRQSQVTEVPAP